MPIYEYICKKCDRKFEAMRPISQADDGISCQFCGSMDTARTITKCFAKSGGTETTFSTTTSGGGCSGCSGGNCAHCGH